MIRRFPDVLSAALSGVFGTPYNPGMDSAQTLVADSRAVPGPETDAPRTAPDTPPAESPESPVSAGPPVSRARVRRLQGRPHDLRAVPPLRGPA